LLAVAPTITDIGDGYYSVLPIAAHRDTLGTADWLFVAGDDSRPRQEQIVASPVRPPTAASIATAVWNFANRTLSAFGFAVTVDTNNDKSGYTLSGAQFADLFDDVNAAQLLTDFFAGFEERFDQPGDSLPQAIAAAVVANPAIATAIADALAAKTAASEAKQAATSVLEKMPENTPSVDEQGRVTTANPTPPTTPESVGVPNGETIAHTGNAASFKGNGGGGDASGPGAVAYVATVRFNGQPIAGADVWITSDIDGHDVIAGTKQTKANGETTPFLLDPGEYWQWVQLARYNTPSPQKIVVGE
ncbi:MAG: hypothetical protein AAFP90_13135, partial [Planctomycetota bacterium]